MKKTLICYHAIKKKPPKVEAYAMKVTHFLSAIIHSD